MRDALYELFDNNEEILNETVELLDQYNGYFTDRMYYDMEMIDEALFGRKPEEILMLSFFGYSEDYVNERGEHTQQFNPNDKYFTFNGYGNLVSTNYIDYSDLIDDVIEILLENNYNDLPQEVLDVLEGNE